MLMMNNLIIKSSIAFMLIFSCSSADDVPADVPADICEIINADKIPLESPKSLQEISKHIFKSHLPKLGADSGNFTKVEVDANGWENCLGLCCNIDNCDVAFFTLSKCFHIHCKDIDSCQPVPSDAAKHNDTYMIIRYLRDSDPSVIPTPTPTDAVTQRPVLTTRSKLVGDPCEPGHFQCVQNAICQKTTSDQLGECRCTEGFSQTSGRTCDPDSLIKHDVTPDTPGPTEVKVTAQPPPITSAAVTLLTVSAGDNQTIRLPDNKVVFTAFVVPEALQAETYTYEWIPFEIPKNAEGANMEGKNTKTLTLSNLITGVYVFKIKVTGNNKFGEGVVNVTVLPPIRINQPPHAIINPSFQEVFLPKIAILDGEDSTDDDKIVSYKWEEVTTPLQENKLKLDEKMLQLVDMVPGNYTFKLTVTDSDGATDSTLANVIIKKEKDYPPQADVGSDVVIHLPQNSLTLYGNASTDDKGVLTYEWTSENKLTAGMVGVRSPILQLSNLEVGDYKFTLKVTDSSGQTDTADVHVFVKPESNHPPVAKTAGHLQLYLPLESLTLDGSNSSDDSGKMAFSWSQKGGPNTLLISNADKIVAIATGAITEGDYEFELTVTDGELQKATDTLIISLKKDVNLQPKADAGGNKVVQLPVGLVTLDGSKSSDDHGIAKFTWKRDSKSLAAGTVVNNSDHKAVLQLVNLVAGQYQFTLTVEDAEGLQSSDSATVIVNNNAHQKDIVEMILDADIDHFTVANKESLQDQLVLLLQKSSEDRATTVEFISVDEDISTGHLCLTFQVLHNEKDSPTIMNGVHALRTLKNKISSGKILDYSIVRLDLSVCQNNCSGHGRCDQKTKLCVCEAFWMPNFFTASMFSTESNCDWSVLYVVIICFIILVAIISSIWAIICCCTSKQCKLTLKARRRHRYSLLRDADDSDKDKIEMHSKGKNGKIQNSSVMISESDLSSDEETLFLSNKKASNGLNIKVANGSRPSYKNKLKT